jgi:hypothetical protein
MSTRPIAKAWFLLLAANDNLRMRTARERMFYALPCETLDDLTTQLALHRRCAPQIANS